MRDLRLRYRGSYLGFLWTLLNPIMFMGIYVVVFGMILKIGTEKYPAFLLAGLVPWAWFSSSVLQGASAVLDGRMYVGKATSPVEVLMVVPVASNLLNLALSLPLLFVVDLIFGIAPGPSLLLLPLVVAMQYAITVSLVKILATYTVFFRDLQQLVALITTFLFYLTPIFYRFSAIPKQYQTALLANPLSDLTIIYQDMFFSRTWPAWPEFAYPAALAVVMFVLGRGVVNRYRDSLVEFL